MICFFKSVGQLTKGNKAFIALTLLLLNPFKTYAEAPNQYFFDNYNEEQGLVHSHVLSLFQDSRGILQS
jgi:hypothetical protein